MMVILLDKAICSWVCCLLWTSVTGSLLTRPQTKTVTRGGRVVMGCSTNLSYGVDWHFVSENGRKEEIYSSGVMSPLYEADYKIEEGKPEGVYNLVIEIAAERHAGKYICIDDEGLGSDTASATLKIQDDNLQNDLPAVEIPEKNYDSIDTQTDDKGDKTVVLVVQSTTIGELPVTAAASPIALIVGIAVGLTVFFAVLIIILTLFYLKGRRDGREKMVDEDSTQNQRFLTKDADKTTNKNLHV